MKFLASSLLVTVSTFAAAAVAMPQSSPEGANESVVMRTVETDVPFRCPICGGGGTEDLEALLRFQQRVFLWAVSAR